MDSRRLNVLRASGGSTDEKEKRFLLGTDIPRRNIISVTFLDTLAKAPAHCWDISQEKNGGILAWAVKTEGGYSFFIAGEGGVAGNANCKELFRHCINLRKISFSGCFDTSQVANMECMFYNCKNIEELDLSSFDTSAATNMGGMFGSCNRLKKLDVGGFDTSHVTNMKFMFCDCRGIQELDLGGFDTSHVADMSGMFAMCSSLKELDISSFRVSEETDRKDMFKYCKNLTRLCVHDLSIANTEGMFSGCCSRLAIIDEKMQVQQNMLRLDERGEGEKKKIRLLGTGVCCKDIRTVTFLDSLAELPQEHWDVSKDGTGSVFAWVRSTVEGCDFYIAAQGKVKGNPNCRDLFRDCENLREVRFQGCFDTRYVADMGSMFENCTRLLQLDVGSFDTSHVTDMRHMFWNCSRIKELDVSRFQTAKVQNMEGMFAGCVNLEKLDISGFETSRVKTMKHMFYGCCALEELDVSGFDTSRTENMEKMFAGCSRLKKLDADHFNMSSIRFRGDMYAGCSAYIRMKYC